VLGCCRPPRRCTAFVADKDPKKREKLVDAVSRRQSSPTYGALQLGDLFQNRKERDHDVRGVKGVRQFHDWLRKQVPANRPWDELARDVLTAAGPNTDSPAVGYYIVTVGEQRRGEQSRPRSRSRRRSWAPASAAPSATTTRSERYTPGRLLPLRRVLQPGEARPQGGEERADHAARQPPRPEPEQEPVGVSQPRTGRFMKPQPLDRTPPR
jgi:hypothetical protein